MIKNVVEPTINVPFRRYIPAGTSHFEIAIPEVYRNRKFTFSHVLFFAEFYNNQAAQLDLDTDYELDEVLNYTVHLHISYLYPNDLFPGAYNKSALIEKTHSFAEGFNNFFEIKKPEGLVSTGAFIDWSDTRLEGSRYSLREWVENIMAVEYYGEPFDPVKHFNALPVSARKLPGVNNYMIPVLWSPTLKACLTYRIHLAPNTSLWFSNGLPVNDMGFSQEMVGKRNGQKKYEFKNPLASSFLFFQSDVQSQENLKPTTNRFNGVLVVTNQNYISEEIDFEISKRELMSNEAIEKRWNAALRKLERSSNVRVGIGFDQILKKFEFLFPQNENFWSMSLLSDPSLLQRMGFGISGEVPFDKFEGKKITDTSDVKDAREKATAVANDAGIIVITDENSSSGNTVGVYERVLADLYPVSEGKMEIRASDSCSTNFPLSIARYMPVVNGYVYARLKLWRFVDNGSLVGSVLKMGSWIQGSLRSL